LPEHHTTRKPSSIITFTAQSIKNTKIEKHLVNTKNSASKPALVALFIATGTPLGICIIIKEEKKKKRKKRF
jgi:hypothetical protein